MIEPKRIQYTAENYGVVCDKNRTIVSRSSDFILSVFTDRYIRSYINYSRLGTGDELNIHQDCLTIRSHLLKIDLYQVKKNTFRVKE